MFSFAHKTKQLEKDFARLGQILDAVDLPIWQRELDLHIDFCNNSYLRLSETSSNSTEINELSKEIHELAGKALETKKPQRERIKFVSNGKQRQFNITEIPTDHGTIGYAQDASELAKIEEGLKINEGVQRQLIESSASAIAIYGSDQKLKFFNNAFINLWKLDESWLGTEPTYGEILEVLREKRKLPEQADFRNFKKENLAMFTGLIEPKEEFYFLPDERSLRVIIVPHTMGGLQFVYEDMTDKLALERSYNTLLDVQSETLSNLQEGVAVFGETGKLTLSNTIYAKFWNLDEKYLESEPFYSEILDKNRDLFDYGQDWEGFKNERLLKILNREQISETLELTTGQVYQIKTVPLPDGEILVTYNDITDSYLIEKSLRETNEALADVDRLKTEFLANISYELRSPLTSIIGFTEILRQGIFGEMNEQQGNYLEDIYNASHQLENLINDILDISTMEAGYMKLDIERFDIHSMLAAVMALVNERAHEHNLKLKFECAPDIGKIFGDEKRLKQVVFNILSNSIKFTPAGGMIMLGAKQDDKNVVIWIEDTGEGIGEDEIKLVFDKFQKTKARGGTGLGLSVAKNFVELHGGQIDIESEIEMGTKVTITLPRENEQLVEEHQQEVI